MKKEFKPFHPVWLDSAGLTAIQHRVLCHLWSRAYPKTECWPSAPTIATACRINKDSVWPAIRILEERGFLEREKAFRNSNRYRLRIGGIEGPTQEVESAEKEGRQSAESKGRHPAESRGCQSAEKEGRKCITKKEDHRRKTNEGVKRQRQEPVSDADFISSLKANPAYAGINIDVELEKAARWIAGHPGRKLTRRFITATWLPRVDKSLAVQVQGSPINLGKRGQHANGYAERTDF